MDRIESIIYAHDYGCSVKITFSDGSIGPCERIATVDAEGFTMKISEVLAAIEGMEPGELMGCTWEDLKSVELLNNGLSPEKADTASSETEDIACNEDSANKPEKKTIQEIYDEWREDVPKDMEYTDDPDLQQIQMIAFSIMGYLRTDDISIDGVNFHYTNRPESQAPAWWKTEDGYAIALALGDCAQWSQMAYQLGWAIAHCMIDLNKPSDHHKIHWVEELICDAHALFAVNYLWSGWENIPLAELNVNYADEALKYTDDCLKRKGTARLSSCSSLEQLKRIDAHICNRPEDRIEETIVLYRLMEDAWDQEALLLCRNYAIPDMPLLDTEHWLADEEYTNTVAYLCHLQDRIPNTRLSSGTQMMIHLETSIPTEAQLDAICDYVLSLRDITGDNIVIQFHNEKDNTPFEGMTFFQLARMETETGNFRVEAGFLNRGIFRMIAKKEAAAEEAEALLRYACKNRSLPNPDSWIEITREALKDSEDKEDEWDRVLSDEEQKKWGVKTHWEKCKRFQADQNMAEYTEDVRQCLIHGAYRLDEESADACIESYRKIIEHHYNKQISAWACSVDIGYHGEVESSQGS